MLVRTLLQRKLLALSIDYESYSIHFQTSGQDSLAYVEDSLFLPYLSYTVTPTKVSVTFSSVQDRFQAPSFSEADKRALPLYPFP